MPSARRTLPAAVAAMLSLSLLGVSPCSPRYAASRNCTDLSMTVTAGAPGVLLPSCPPFTDAMEVSFEEQISITHIPSDLRFAIVATRRSNTIQISAIASAVRGVETVRIHTEPLVSRPNLIARDYLVAVTIDAAPEPDAGIPDSGSPDSGADAGSEDAGTADAGADDAGSGDAGTGDGGASDAGTDDGDLGFSVSVNANPLVTPTGGTTTLSSVVSGGIGPFLYAWRGYRDDGSLFSYTLSSTSAAQPTAALVFPGSDFYFFVTVTDCQDHQPVGNPESCTQPDGGARPTRGAYVRVHEADDVVARFTVGPPSIHAGVTAVHLDASASTGVVTPIGWTLQYLGDTTGQRPASDPARPAGIEGWLRLQTDSNGTLFWNEIFFTAEDVLTYDLSATYITQPGAYRVLLQENGDISTHQTYEYFWVDP